MFMANARILQGSLLVSGLLDYLLGHWSYTVSFLSLIIYEPNESDRAPEFIEC